MVRDTYARPTEKKSRMLLPVIAVVILCLAGLILWLTLRGGESVYLKLVRDGYRGSQEQWLASLVGEEATAGEGRSAYSLACENGYTGSEQQWLEAHAGGAVAQTGITAYKAARTAGYRGSLAQWLTSIAEEPDKLGRSAEGTEKTEYELACAYGYTGTFIQWLISVVNDRGTP